LGDWKPTLPTGLTGRLIERIPTKEEYMADVGVIAASGAEIYRYMNFDQIEEYQDVAKTVAA